MNLHSDDDVLIVALADPKRAREACVILHRRYARRFMNYLRRRGLDHAAAEDAVQDAFVRLLQKASGFQPQGQGRAWIWRVARSAWLDNLRVSRLATEPLQGAHEQAAAVADVAVTSNYQDCVHGQLARFSEAYPEAGQAIVWAAVDGLKSTQIAELIGRSAGATREFLSQTRKRLREYLEPCLGLESS